MKVWCKLCNCRFSLLRRWKKRDKPSLTLYDINKVNKCSIICEKVLSHSLHSLILIRKDRGKLCSKLCSYVMCMCVLSENYTDSHGLSKESSLVLSQVGQSRDLVDLCQIETESGQNDRVERKRVEKRIDKSRKAANITAWKGKLHRKNKTRTSKRKINKAKWRSSIVRWYGIERRKKRREREREKEMRCKNETIRALGKLKRFSYLPEF